MTKKDRSTTFRTGFTIIELLVSIAILAVLVALLFPAVLNARRTAETVSCKNRLKQFAFACHAHATDNGDFAKDYDSHTSLLPYLGLPAEAILAGFDDASPFQPIPGGDSTILVCPSDEWGTPSLGHVSFGLSQGVDSDESLRGVESRSDVCSPRDILDGASNSILAAEVLIGPAAFYHQTERFDELTSAGLLSHSPERHWIEVSCLPNKAAARDVCRSRRSPVVLGHVRGSVNYGVPGGPRFDHLMTPNSNNCFCQESIFGAVNVIASGRHEGGVNAAFADGSVHFMSEGVDGDVWIALGSVRGNEVFSGHSF